MAPGKYMLLSEAEKELFHKAVKERNPLVYTDEFKLEDLES